MVVLVYLFVYPIILYLELSNRYLHNTGFHEIYQLFFIHLIYHILSQFFITIIIIIYSLWICFLTNELTTFPSWQKWPKGLQLSFVLSTRPHDPPPLPRLLPLRPRPAEPRRPRRQRYVSSFKESEPVNEASKQVGTRERSVKTSRNLYSNGRFCFGVRDRFRNAFWEKVFMVVYSASCEIPRLLSSAYFWIVLWK